MKLLLLFLFFPVLSFAQELKIVKGYRFTLSSKNTSTDTSLYSTIWINSKNEIVKEEKVWQDQRGKNKIIKTYDPKGNLVRKEAIYKDSTFVSITEFERDSHNNLSKQIFSGTDGNFALLHNNVLDARGNLVKSVFTPDVPGGVKPDDMVGKTEYKYDTSNNLIQMTQYLGPNRVNESFFAYDSNGNKISEVTKDKNGEVKYHYEFNLTKQKITQKYYEGSMLKTVSKYTWVGSIISEERSLNLDDGSTTIVIYKL